MTTDFVKISVDVSEALSDFDERQIERVQEAIIDEATAEFYPLVIAYPAEGEWNRPGAYPKRWYQRKFGPRWARVDGSIGGRNTSEQMQGRWVTERPSIAEVRMHNTASYSEYVIGEDQASFHAQHGWLKVRELGERFAPRLQAIADRVIRRLFG